MAHRSKCQTQEHSDSRPLVTGLGFWDGQLWSDEIKPVAVNDEALGKDSNFSRRHPGSLDIPSISARLVTWRRGNSRGRERLTFRLVSGPDAIMPGTGKPTSRKSGHPKSYKQWTISKSTISSASSTS